MAIKDSDFLLIHRDGENYKAPVSDLQLDMELDLDFAPTNHTHSNYASSSHTHSGYASSSHTHSGYASSSHNHNGTYVKGNFTISKSNGIFYIS